MIKYLDILKIIIIILCIMLIFLIMTILIYNQNIKKKNRDSILLFKARYKKRRNSFLYSSYIFFSSLFITRRYIRRLKNQIEIIRPENRRLISERTMKIAYSIWGIIFVIIIFILFISISVYTFILSCMSIYILNSQITNMIINSEEVRLLKQFEKYLSDVRHFFHAHGTVDESIYEASETASYELGLHINIIYDVLISTDIDEGVQRYNEISPNKYLKTFLALCVTVIQYGDKKIDNQSLFLSNIKYLKQEIYIELLKREKIKHLFSGLIVISLIPMFTLKIIENFGVYCLPELKLHYVGAFGTTVIALVLVFTMFSYLMLNRLKENNEVIVKEHFILEQLLHISYLNKKISHYVNRNWTKMQKRKELLKRVGEGITLKQFILKQIIASIVSFICCFTLIITIHETTKQYNLGYVENVKNLSSGITDKQLPILKELIKKYVKKYRNIRIININKLEELVVREIINEKVITGNMVIGITANDIIKRIKQYQNEYLKWYEVLICLIISCIIYNLPYWMILYRKRIMQMNMEDEVIQFHSIVLMLMHIDRMTIETVLTYLEDFAVIFKRSISNCLNNIESGDLNVLEQLKIDEPFEPFKRLIDNLLISDRIGIEKAFDEIVTERLHYQDKRQQENEISINNKAVIGKVIAYIPMTLTIGFHLIVPFVLEGIRQLGSFIAQMQSM